MKERRDFQFETYFVASVDKNFRDDTANLFAHEVRSFNCFGCILSIFYKFALLEDNWERIKKVHRFSGSHRFGCS